MSRRHSVLECVRCWLRQPISCGRPRSRRAPPRGATPENRTLPSVSATPIFNEDFNQSVGTLPSTSTWTYSTGTDPNNTAVHYIDDSSTLSVVNDPNASDGKALGLTIYPTSAGNQTF